ncbi:MAG: HNH endonuclease [Ignavibacteria bacterium]|jgi:putative restriction endonuclease|nr:HNH endonuclease [Ignavibacteria bacterium]MCU7526224.1 HNH endonuclease [Ignavibacteria bacterium]
MKEGQRLWTREELILALNLYSKIDFGKIHSRNPEIIKLSHSIKRTPGSVSYKLVNFASLDPARKARGIRGASNASKLDREIWNEFYNNLDDYAFESEKLKADIEHSTVEKENDIDEEDLPKEGKERESIVKTRVNQSFFRKLILASYNNTCCITGIQQPNLLVAGHIRPWRLDEKNRMNPQNGIAINALHDKAFEDGLMTITPDYKIKISSVLLDQADNPPINEYFVKYHDKEIKLPWRFLPDREFLQYHFTKRFIQ